VTAHLSAKDGASSGKSLGEILRVGGGSDALTAEQLVFGWVGTVTDSLSSSGNVLAAANFLVDAKAGDITDAITASDLATALGAKEVVSASGVEREKLVGPAVAAAKALIGDMNKFGVHVVAGFKTLPAAVKTVYDKAVKDDTEKSSGSVLKTLIEAEAAVDDARTKTRKAAIDAAKKFPTKGATSAQTPAAGAAPKAADADAAAKDEGK
jgi:hypothetical protein